MDPTCDPPDRDAVVDLSVWRAAAEASHVPICLSDPSEPDAPLVWVNPAFTRVTGYTAAEVVGRNCRFLQGPDTDQGAVERIRAALRAEESVTETLLNHRRDGAPFWNRLSLSPLRDAAGRVRHYVGVQDDVTAQVEALAARAAALAEAERVTAELTQASEREHATALALQTGLLPRLSPVPGFDVATRYVPSTAGISVGGDWYDVVELPGERVAMVVGDVMGHDLRAAAAMGQLRSMMRALAWSDPDPAHVIGRLDELARAVLDVTFASVFYCVSSSTDDTLSWARAGHPPPLLREPGGRISLLDDVVCPPVGVVSGRAVPTATTSFPRGSTLVLYTDGLIETRDRTVDDGLTVLMHTIGAVAPSRTARDVRDAVVGALVPDHPADDTCVLVVHRTR